MIQENSSNIITTQDFIEKGFFPKELVPAFTTENLADNLDKINSNIQNPSKKSSKFLSYSFPKSKYSRRILGIPNPLHQVVLCNFISQEWQDIENFILSSPLCQQSPLSYKRRAVSSYPINLPAERAISSASHRYRLYTDISRFYSTIYTHSIPWALHEKQIAKANRRDKSLIGNQIDEFVRNTQDQQTLGIPIGPDSSFVIAEIISSSVDKILTERLKSVPQGFRYVDDYYLYFNSYSEAERALSEINRILQEFELEINSSKASIVELPEPIELSWVSEIRRCPIGDDNSLEQYNDILTYFSKVFEYSKLFPDDAVIKYALSRINRTDILEKNWKLCESFILQSIIAAPNALIVATEILLKYSEKYQLNLEKISETIHLILLQHSELNHSHEISWALWLSKTLSIPIKEEVAKKISHLEDSIVALITLDLNSSNLIEGKIDFSLWQSILTIDHLYSSNWLLCYEANIKGYFPQTPQNNYIENDDFFAVLKQNNVSFYDGSKQIKLENNDEEIDEEEIDDEDNLGYDSSGFWFWY
ncbi:RNA-directed DNA polymerase [Nostoc sp. 'Peltigera membranacea cyanobiont' N6]|uniref:RNA-directed DNA polymerase n=1 Tax=Nostoc sp. 'Peltigera membranacea cyanobiont' N6 TaxID=1261031 RepID=UPI000CF32394|nr:RNA-directed DNA polymerase [Nostoc sp. 'Peltigera membranacea cyanobiont' N6]AVH65505.1 reverse transcriptase [Nostoc sp. 'Peltigera membranacea cyanobiont' N6]